MKDEKSDAESADSSSSPSSQQPAPEQQSPEQPRDTSASPSHQQPPDGRPAESQESDLSAFDEGMALETIRIQLIRPATGSRLRVRSSVRARTPMRRLFENYQELLAALYPGWDVESISRFRSVPNS